MTTYCYYDVTPPTRWQAGTVGADHKPFYFDCADCGAEEPEIAGFAGVAGLDHAPTLDDVAAIRRDGGMYKLAMYCASCYARRVSA